MVRRRARTAKSSTTAGGIGSASVELPLLTGAVVNGNLTLRDDQYFASPKRKDCKIDNGQVDPMGLVGAVLMQPTTCEDESEEGASAKSPSPGKTRGERGGIAGRTIGVPLATRSQTRTIENFFKANTAAKNAKLKEADSEQIASNTIIALPTIRAHVCASPPAAEELHNGHSPPAAPPRTLHRRSASHMQPDFIFDLSEDTNDTDNTELSDEATSGASNAIDFETHRSPLRDSHGSSRSSTTDNIFLQEPVLTLNVDKSPNQASSIKINRSLEIEPIFSSPPSSLTAATLNGRFNQIVSLNGLSPGKRESFGYETQARANANAHYSLPEEHHYDTSSCDSGVAFVSSLDNNNSPLAQVVAQLNRQRKPATPHRIVCPSPIKSMAPRVVSPGGGTVGNSPSPRKLVASKGDLLSPRKSQRHLATVASKTRRRLNQQKEQAPYPPTTTITAPEIVKMENGHNIDDDEETLQAEINAGAADEDDQEFENVEEVESAMGYCGAAINGLPAAAKSILNSAKHPSAQQNTTNNNQDHHINSTKSGGGHHKSKTTPSVAIKPQPKMKQHFQAPQPLTSSSATNNNNNGNRELTDFFPVRRSVRKTKTAVKEEMMRNLEQAVLEERAEGLKVAYFDGKGRGIVSDRRFQRGEFVVEYVGDLISMTEAAEREKRYALDENAGCYMYYFKHNNQQYCIDATHDTGKLGRLVNHSRNGNLITKVVVVKQRPHLILIAKDDIEEGEELTYDYGDRSKESLLHHPWLAF